MKKMTEANLKDAFAGESQAHMKYLSFAAKAEQEGLAHVARLFRAASHAEQIHATKHLRALSGVGTTADNLDAAIGGETFEFEDMYPAYLAVAKEESEAQAEKSMSRAMEAEKIHADLYKRAKAAVAAGRDTEMGDVWICEGCGWTVEGDAPDVCPLCGAKRERFTKF